MREPSTLGYALLGLLARGRASGYDLTQGMRVPVGFFWHAGHSQIYPELARLEEAGLVEHERVEQSERPDKKLYRLTGAGQAALAAWVSSPLPPERTRDELTLRAYSLWLADPAAALTLFREHAEAHEARHAVFQAKLDELERAHPKGFARLDSPDFGQAAVLMRGISHSREYAGWCRWVMGQLERGLGPQET